MSTTTEPLIGLQKSLDLAKQMLRERRGTHASLALSNLARDCAQAAEDMKQAAARTCRHCRGTGFIPRTAKSPEHICPRCEGKGSTERPADPAAVRHFERLTAGKEAA